MFVKYEYKCRSTVVNVSRSFVRLVVRRPITTVTRASRLFNSTKLDIGMEVIIIFSLVVL